MTEREIQLNRDFDQKLWDLASPLLTQRPDLERFPTDRVIVPESLSASRDIILANFFQTGPLSALPPEQIPILDDWRLFFLPMLVANPNNARLWMIAGQNFIHGQERVLQGEFQEVFQLILKGKEKVDDLKERYRRASKCWERAIDIDPKQPVLLLRLGEAFVQASGTETSWTKAMRCWKKAVEMRPNLAPAWFNMGSRHDFTYDWDRAQECYKEALKHNPNHVPTLIKYGYLSVHLGRKGDANDMFRHAALLDPDYNKRPEYLSARAFHYGQGF